MGNIYTVGPNEALIVSGDRGMETPLPSLSMENPCPGQADGLPAYYFVKTVQMLMASHCMLGDPNDYPKDYGNASAKLNVEFDFIIVGGGSSGSVIANRLSENKNWNVLLIETGGNPTFQSDIPGFVLSLAGRNLDWGFGTNKTEGCCLGMEDESCSIFQGKVLGGTSTINYKHYFRGHKQDYDDWARAGNEDWSYEEVLKYFKRSEGLHEDFRSFSNDEYEERLKELKTEIGNKEQKLHSLSKMVVGKYHSRMGELRVDHYAYDISLSRMKRALFAAGEELGIPFVTDFNGGTQIGFSYAMGTIYEGNRGNTAKCFLTPIKDRKNLYVIKNATVRRINFNGTKAIGVTLVRNGSMQIVLAKKEVIVSAGVINTPRLLLLSGIGSKHQLDKLSIKVVQDLQGVGENLKMHLTFVGLPILLAKDKFERITLLQKIDAMYAFVTRGNGFFGNSGMGDVVGFVDSQKNSSVPDIQYLHYLNRIEDYYTFNELLTSLKVKDQIRDQYSEASSKSNVLLICPTLLKPKSKGKVRLVSSHFKDAPEIIPNFLTERDDVATLIRGIRLAINLTKSRSFKEFEPELLRLNIERCNKIEYDTDRYWECLLRYLATSMYDAAGTCKMGPRKDPLSVVDERLRVHGIEGLRVADSSIMPDIVRGSTSVASVMIGEKVSDFIKEDWKRVKHDEL